MTASTGVALFDASGNTTISPDTGRTILGITFDSVASAYSVGSAGGNTLYLSSTGTIQTSSNAVETIYAPLVIAGAGATYSFANNSASGTLDFAGQISGGTAGNTVLTLGGSNTNNNTIGGNIVNGSATSLGVTMSGTGLWVLSGANSYTGTTTVSSGTLQFNGASTMSSNSALSLGNGSTIALRSNASATFAPASMASTGTLTTLNFDVNNLTTGSSNTLTLTGALSLANSSSDTINVTGGNGYTLAFGGINLPTSSSNHVLTIKASSANVNTGVIYVGSFGATVDLVGSQAIAVTNLSENSNGSSIINIGSGSDSPTVTFLGATVSTGSRASGNLAFDLNSGTFNVNAAGVFANPGGAFPTSFTINGGTIDNTSGSSISATLGSTTLAGNFSFGGTNSLTLSASATLQANTPISITANGSKTLTFGNLTMSGNALALASGSTGNVTFGGTSVIGTGNTIANGSTGTFSFGSIASSNLGSVDITTGGVYSSGSNGAANSLIMSIMDSVNNGADFAYIGAGGLIQSRTAGAGETALPGGGTGSSGSLTVYFLTGSQTLTTSETAGALRINDTSTTDSLTLGANTLTLGGAGTSGILYNGGTNGNYLITGTGFVTGGTGHSMNINTYSGTLTISAPMLDGSGNTFDVLNKSGAGTLILSGTNTYGGTSGGTNIGGGTLDLGNGNTGSYASTQTINVYAGATLGIGMVNGSTLAAPINDVGNIVGIEATGVTNTITGTINTSTLTASGGFTQNGLGTTVLAGSNLYTGATQINAGAIEVTSATGLGAAVHDTSSVTVASGGALQLANNITTTGASPLILNGAGRTGAANGALENISGTNTYTGSVTLNSAASIGSDSGTLTLSGTVGGANALTLMGAGNITFSNTVSGLNGVTDNSTGTVSFSNNLSSLSGTVAINSGVASFSGSVGGSAGLTVNTPSTVTLSGSNTYSGGTSVTAGTLVLSNSSNGSATGTGSLTVSGGATLAGNGRSSGAYFSVGGTGTATGSRATVLAGLNSTSDSNTSQVLTMLATSTSTITNANLTFNLNANVAGALGSDPSGSGTELSVGGTKVGFGTSVGSVELTLDLQNEPTIIGAYTPYVLIAGTVASGGGGVGGSQYTGLSLGTVLVNSGGITETVIGGSNLQIAFGSTIDQQFYGANSYLVLYQDTNTNVDDIDVIVVPEPGTWALMLGGLATLVFWQRRRRN